jgi:hypothetical protein
MYCIGLERNSCDLVDCTHLADDMRVWAVVNTVMNLRSHKKWGISSLTELLVAFQRMELIFYLHLVVTYL